MRSYTSFTHVVINCPFDFINEKSIFVVYTVLCFQHYGETTVGNRSLVRLIFKRFAVHWSLFHGHCHRRTQFKDLQSPILSGFKTTDEIFGNIFHNCIYWWSLCSLLLLLNRKYSCATKSFYNWSEYDLCIWCTFGRNLLSRHMHGALMCFDLCMCKCCI